MLLARVLRGQKKKCGANFDLRDDDDSSLITEGPFNNYVDKMGGHCALNGVLCGHSIQFSPLVFLPLWILLVFEVPC